MEKAQLNNIELSIFISRIEAICWEMGAVLRQAALSPNIKDRLDFSCALFDASGELFGQAAHIPVHLGSMAYAMAALVGDRAWQAGDVLVVNDPYLGGTHLPDVTMVSPVIYQGELFGFAANRAHHANIGADIPGSMPISTRLEEEGIVIPPTLMCREYVVIQSVTKVLFEKGGADLAGDFSAQVSANRVGVERFLNLIEVNGPELFRSGIDQINDYGERLTRRALEDLPKGCFVFKDLMDDDGCGTEDIPIKVAITLTDDGIEVDFEGTAGQVKGNLNCPISVAAAGVFYAIRCLLPKQTPACAGTFRCITLKAPKGSLVNAQRPAAVAAGNVETSMRIVDAVFGALAQAIPARIPAASQGTMNNIAMGRHSQNHHWDYYETMAGGTGAYPDAAGVDGVHSHMTNTLNTPIESIEMHYPLRVREYSINQGTGGAGQFSGGNGLCRELEFLAETDVTVISERRRHAPWGLAGGQPGRVGRNLLDGMDIPGKCQLSVKRGQILRIETPGGGGFGDPVIPKQVE